MCYQTKITKQKEEIAERFNAEIDALNDLVVSFFSCPQCEQKKCATSF
tara:strand:+ start:769 stop:912 length:144 start_codon:yes stop_codon:yes gene_type:complete